jgi:micrococcal nuclease
MMGDAWRWYRGLRTRWQIVLGIAAIYGLLTLAGAAFGEDDKPSDAAPPTTTTETPPPTSEPATTEEPPPTSAEEPPATAQTENAKPAPAKKPKRKKPRARFVVISEIIDGDTITVSGGRRVRLLQIDTPELSEGECYANEASADLARLIPVGSRVRLVTDPALDQVDRYGRLLRYVVKPNGANVNIVMVKQGSAAPYFYGGDHGRHSGQLYAAAVAAKRARRGLWRACPATQLRPNEAITALAAAPPPVTGGGGGGNCDRQSYPDACIPPYPPDLDCDDVSATAFAVRPPDPHGFDGDADGIGCES